MYTKWTSHLTTAEEKERFESKILGSKVVLERQLDVLNEMEQDLNQTEANPKTYDIPNWDYRQAHNNGYRQCLNILKKFIDLDKQQTNKEPKSNDQLTRTRRPTADIGPQ